MNSMTIAKRPMTRTLRRPTTARIVHRTDPRLEDEEIAVRSHAAVLITASTRRSTEAVARRIHDAGPRALRAHYAGLIDAASGDSLP